MRKEDSHKLDAALPVNETMKEDAIEFMRRVKGKTGYDNEKGRREKDRERERERVNKGWFFFFDKKNSSILYGMIGRKTLCVSTVCHSQTEEDTLMHDTW
jgi:hypothetical protein